MDRAADLLGRVARRLRRPEAPIAWLASSWTRIVGDTIAAHARPVRCGAGCLEISADGQVWQRQLEEMARDLCDRINAAWGSLLVQEVKFVGPDRHSPISSAAPPSKQRAVRRSVPYELDNEHTPFIRTRK